LDDGMGEVVFVAQRAEAGRAQYKQFAGRRFEAEPADTKHAEEVAAGEKEYVAARGAGSAHDAVGAGGDLSG
jgi:hypothetical protein